MIDLLLNPPLFLILALVGGLLIALIAAPLGVFMVWQKQSYFGAAWHTQRCSASASACCWKST